MKKKFLFLASLAVLAFGACNNENDIPSTGPDTGKAKGFLSISLSAPPSARTSGTPTESGEPSESTISDVTIVLTDASGSVQHVATPNIAGGKTEPFDIALGTYKAYALVNNPLSGSTAIAIGTPIARVVDVASAAVAINGFNNGKFFMVNAHHDNSTDAGVEVTITASNTETAPAKAQIFVDRVAVKIIDNTATKAKAVAAGTTGFPSTVTSLEIQGFSLLNMNKQFNLIQTWGQTNTNGAPLTADVLSTPLPSYGANGLPKDQYFYHYDQYVTLTKDANDKITAIEDLTVGASPAISFGFETVYTTENRPTIQLYDTDKLTAGRGETTGVIYKVQAKAGTSNAPTFYVYNGESYANVAAINSLPEFTGEDLSTLTIPQLRGKGIKVYENGVMYYTYFIKDNNPLYQYTGEDYYAVLRNSVYKLNVDNINNIGDDVPGGGTVDPNGPGTGPEGPGTGPTNPPIDADKAYIEVSVTVNPWVLNLIDIEF